MPVTEDISEAAASELLNRIPVLGHDLERTCHIFCERASRRMSRNRSRTTGQFKSPGQSPRGQQFGRQHYPGGPQLGMQGYHMNQSGGYPSNPGMERRMASAEGDSFLQHPDESYDYQPLASDDSQGTQHSSDTGQQQQAVGFHGAFGDMSGAGSNQQGDQQQHMSDSKGGIASASAPQAEGGGGNGQPQSPPDMKYDVMPVSFMKPGDFELIEIDPDDEEEI